MLFLKTSFFLMYLQVFGPLRWLRLCAYAGVTFTTLSYGVMTVLSFALCLTSSRSDIISKAGVRKGAGCYTPIYPPVGNRPGRGSCYIAPTHCCRSAITIIQAEAARGHPGFHGWYTVGRVVGISERKELT